jgi:hypothetical protein
MVDIPFTGDVATNACRNLTQGSCPITIGQLVTHQLQIEVIKYNTKERDIDTKSVSNEHIGGCLMPSLGAATIFKNFLIDCLKVKIFK